MKKILITGIGGDIAQSTAKIIREHNPELELIGTDTHSQHGGSLFVDKVLNLPFANTQEYLPAVSSLLTCEHVDVVFPMTEPELAVIGPLVLQHSEISWITAGDKVIKSGIDKLATVLALEKLGIPVPWTIEVDQGKPKSFPCILKNRYGSGSRAVFTVHDEIEAAYLAERYPQAVYQELLEPADKEVTCAVYRTKDGRVSTLQMLRKLVGGFTGWAKVINNAEITSMCSKIAEGLDLRGSMNVQLRITKAGPRVFEINPRISSTVLMRNQLGYTDVIWALNEAEGLPVQFPHFEDGRIMVRTQGSAVLNS